MRNRVFHRARIGGIIFEGIISADGPYIEDRASGVMQTTRWVNSPGTPASPERGRPFWDAQDLRDAVCGRQIGFQMVPGRAIQRTDGW